MQATIKAAKNENDQVTARTDRNRFIVSGYQADVATRIVFGVATRFAFAERLLAFWSNHFTVSTRKYAVSLLAGPYEAEALYPNIAGSFADLLKAAEHHSAMLEYLDQAESIGPNSPAGKKKSAGLNENLAREILELHTLGVHGGYSQDDVTEFARIITGWTIDREAGTVVFRPNWAEPGPHTLLGKRFGGTQPQADNFGRALDLLATHPATAHHIATKLVRHFISDDPPPNAVAAVEKTFIASGGNLSQTYLTLVSLPEARSPTGAKARNDRDFLIAALRAANISQQDLLDVPDGKKVSPLTVGALRVLHHGYWNAPSPAGWPEDADEWLNSTGLAARFEIIPRILQAAPNLTVDELLTNALGHTASDQTRSVIASASNKLEAMSLIFASPEFNRR